MLQFSVQDWVSETAPHLSGLRGQQRRLSWDKLDHLMNEEPQLLCQESKRLQTVVQNTQADLTHSREKVTQKQHVVEMTNKTV
jgi:ninein